MLSDSPLLCFVLLLIFKFLGLKLSCIFILRKCYYKKMWIVLGTCVLKEKDVLISRYFCNS